MFPKVPKSFDEFLFPDRMGRKGGLWHRSDKTHGCAFETTSVKKGMPKNCIDGGFKLLFSFFPLLGEIIQLDERS